MNPVNNNLEKHINIQIETKLVYLAVLNGQEN